MLVSHRHGFIYTKTLKTAGTSVEVYFEPFCMREGEWVPSHYREEYVSETGIVGRRCDDHVAVRQGWWNHMPAQDIRDRLGQDCWDRYFKFCVVRDPYEKMISAFFFAHQGREECLRPELSPKLFALWLTSFALPVDRNKYLLDGAFALNDVIRHESLADDMGRICRRLDLPWEPQRMPRYKMGVRPDWASAAHMYEPESRQVVQDAFAYEFQAFGYPV